MGLLYRGISTTPLLGFARDDVVPNEIASSQTITTI